MTAMRLFLLGLFCVLSLSPFAAQAERSRRDFVLERRQHVSKAGLYPGTQRISIDVNGTQREFLVHMPKIILMRTMPVVLSFHGFGVDAASEEKITGFSSLSDKKGFIAVYPEAIDGKWHVFGHSDQDVVFIRALMDYMSRTYAIDPRKVYANGISNGAQMTWRLACDASDLFTAFGLVAGNYPSLCTMTARRPLILFHGTDDRLLPYEGRAGLMGPRAFALGWAAREDCALLPEGKIIYEFMSVTGESWTCPDSPEVRLYTAQGAGHSWPGSPVMPAAITTPDVDATGVMWEFFDKITK